MPRGRRASDRTRPGSPCTSGMAALAIRARRGVPTASRLLDGSTGAGISHPAPPDMSGTTPRATERDRSSRPPRGAGRPRRRRDAGLVSRHRADLEVRRRSGGSDPGQPWKFADGVAVFRPLPSTRSTTTVNRPPRPFTQTSGRLQGFRARPRAFVNARETRTFHGKEGVVGSSPTEGSAFSAAQSHLLVSGVDVRDGLAPSISRPRAQRAAGLGAVACSRRGLCAG